MQVRCKFALSKSLNPKLYERVLENIEIRPIREKDTIAGRRTSMDFHKRNIKEVNILITWLQNILPSVSLSFASTRRPRWYKPFAKVELDTMYGFDPYSFKLEECWGVEYNKGEYLQEHNHFPYVLTFVYAVKMPKGSSALTIRNKDVRLQEGECIFFLSSEFHRVKDNNNCDGRCVITGNYLYTPP